MWARRCLCVAYVLASIGVRPLSSHGQIDVEEDLLGVEPAETPVEASDPPVRCPDCDGAGNLQCPDCQGSGEGKVECPQCRGSAQLDCSNCDGGYNECSGCLGKGRRWQVDFGIGGSSRYVDCPPKVACGVCRTRGFKECTRCRSLKGFLPATCGSCAGKKLVSCPTCEGDGELAVEAAPQPELEGLAPLEAQAASQLPRLMSLHRQLQELLADVERLQGDARKPMDRFADFQKAMQALGPGKSAPRPLLELRSLLDDKWELCEGAREEVQLLLGKLQTLESRAASRLAEIRAIGDRQSSSRKPMPLDEVWLQGHENAVAAAESTADDCKQACARFEVRLGRLEEEIAAYRRSLQEHAERESRTTAEAQARGKTFQHVARVFERLARENGFQDPACQLLPSRTARDLEVELVLFDPGATFDGDGHLPSEATLVRLVPLVTGLFRASPDVEELRLRLDGVRLGETGHAERQEVQRFAIERPRWQALTSGAYREAPLEILSRAHPTPPYPRPRPGLTSEAWPIIVLIGLLFFAVSLVYVARTRMMS